MNDTAYCIVTMDIRTGAIVNVGIFSEERPTSMDLRHHLQLEAARMTAPVYSSASRRLVEHLRDHPGSMRWLYDHLSEHDRRVAITGRP